MISLEKLVKYIELVTELQETNPTYRNVVIEIPEVRILPLDTPIKETWSNGHTGRFHSIEFTANDLDHINRKLYQKIRYFKTKKEEAVE